MPKRDPKLEKNRIEKLLLGTPENNYTDKMPDFIKKFDRYLELTESRTLPTRAAYLSDIKVFFDWLLESDVLDVDSINKISENTLDGLTFDAIQDYLIFLRQKPNKNKPDETVGQLTINRNISTLKTLYFYLRVKVETISNNVMDKFSVKKPKVTTSARDMKFESKIYSANELHEKLEFIDTEYEKTMQRPGKFLANKERDLAILALLNGSAIRVSELVNMDIEDINLETGEFINWRKGNKEDVSWIAPSYIPYIKNYLEIRDDRYKPVSTEKAMFLTSSKGIIGRISKRQIQNITQKYMLVSPHKLRHSAITAFYGATHDIAATKKYAGHETVETTRAYIHTSKKVINQGLDKL